MLAGCMAGHFFFLYNRKSKEEKTAGCDRHGRKEKNSGKRKGVEPHYVIVGSKECKEGIYYQTGSGQGAGAERCEFLGGGGGVCGDHGGVGIRQDHTAQHSRLSG